jgi:hypothetical protein
MVHAGYHRRRRTQATAIAAATAGKLSVRSKDGRSRLARVVTREAGFRADLLKPRIVLLIHGYNTSEDHASAAFSAFSQELRRSHAGEAAGVLWEFHWPGDLPQGFRSKRTYSARVGDARNAGEKLADFLEDLERQQRLVIVAHSLGCRVALEAVRAIIDRGNSYTGPRLRHVALLAAAVPDALCKFEATDSYPYCLERCQEHVLHSPKDKVLRFGFPIGQRDYGEPDHAVGLDGRPFNRWSTRVNTWLDHGDYWTDPGVAIHIAKIAGARPHRPSNPWYLPSWRAERHAIRPARNVARHTLPARSQT